jgi:hypothetical protein
MHASKLTTAIIISGFLIVGLLYSPVCNLNCAFYAGAQTVATTATQESDQSSHCHRHADTKSPAAPSTLPQQSAPHDDSRNCPAHDDAMTLPVGATATIAMNQLAQPLVAALPVAITVSVDDLLDHSIARAPLRSPPRRAVILPLRI